MARKRLELTGTQFLDVRLEDPDVQQDWGRYFDFAEVPVLLVNGRMLIGYNRRAYLNLLASAR